MNRRRLLAGVGTAAGVAIAGCTGEDDGLTEERSVTLSLSNGDDADRAFEVRLLDGDAEVVLRMDGTLQAATIEDEPTTLVSRRHFEDAPYDVRIAVGETEVAHHWEPAECPDLAVDVTVRNAEPELDPTCT